MNVDFKALREGMAAAIPFNIHLGLEVLEIGHGTATVRLPDDDHLRNHVGSQHAAGLFAAAEAASGGAFVGTFVDVLGEITPLAAAAEISYTKLAQGPIEARATLADADALLQRLHAEGRISFPVEVALRNGDGETVATAAVRWHVRKNA